tara:strand:+ start:44 stop:418 length:375 start_codon:yes stop_codon:yes gene_type:complete
MSAYTSLIESLKSKQLRVAIPSFLIMAYALFIYISMFVVLLNGGSPIDKLVDFWMSYTPQWIISGTSWPAVISKLLWSCIFGAFPTIIALLLGAMIILRGVAYLFGFIGHIFLFLKKLILDQQL